MNSHFALVVASGFTISRNMPLLAGGGMVNFDGKFAANEEKKRWIQMYNKINPKGWWLMKRLKSSLEKDYRKNIISGYLQALGEPTWPQR